MTYGTPSYPMIDPATNVPHEPGMFVGEPVTLAGMLEGLGFDFSGLVSSATQAAGTAMEIRTAIRSPTRPAPAPAAGPIIISQPSQPTVLRAPAVRTVNWPLVGGLGAVVVVLGFLAFRGRSAKRNPPRGSRRAGSRRRRSSRRR